MVVKVAVNVAAVGGVVMLWVWAPPSDHDWNTKFPWSGASTLITHWSHDVTVCGPTRMSVPFTTMLSPAGAVSKVRAVVWGLKFWLIVWARPWESVAVRRISR